MISVRLRSPASPGAIAINGLTRAARRAGPRLATAATIITARHTDRRDWACGAGRTAPARSAQSAARFGRAVEPLTRERARELGVGALAATPDRPALVLLRRDNQILFATLGN